MLDAVKKRLEEFLAGCLGPAGLELFELNTRYQGKTVAIEVVIDRPHGGITIDECATVNKRVDALLEQEKLCGDDYTVTVCSPGLDRPLKTHKDFVRVGGNEVRFYLAEPVEERIEYSGKLKEVGVENVVVEFKDHTVTIPLRVIQKAVLVI